MIFPFKFPVAIVLSCALVISSAGEALAQEASNLNHPDINYQYDGDKLTTELNNDGSVIAKYSYSSGGQLLKITRGTTNYYPITDGLGSIISVRDSSGNTINSYEYDEWGKVINKTEAFPLPLRFAGYWQDNDANLYHLGARWYDPSLYRFTSVDPHPGDQDDSTSLNEYLYVKNNPLIYTDHDGDIPFLAIGFMAWGLYDLYKTYQNPNRTRQDMSLAVMGILPGGKVTKLKGIGNVTEHFLDQMIKRKISQSTIRASLKQTKDFYDPKYGTKIHWNQSTGVAVARLLKGPNKGALNTVFKQGKKPKSRWRPWR